jgi:hypothetical protein
MVVLNSTSVILSLLIKQLFNSIFTVRRKTEDESLGLSSSVFRLESTRIPTLDMKERYQTQG